MKRVIFFTLMVFCLAIMNTAQAEETEVMNFVKRLAKEKITALASDPIVVNAVKTANKEAVKSLDEIKQLDEKWQAADGIDARIESFLTNPCAQYLKKMQKAAVKISRSLYAEIFVMDKQGCIVAETNKTSDYWQGDEDKFVKSFADGNGAIFIDAPAFDQSSGMYSIQVSVPVVDPSTKKAIGAVTVSVDIDAIAERFY